MSHSKQVSPKHWRFVL